MKLEILAVIMINSILFISSTGLHAQNYYSISPYDMRHNPPEGYGTFHRPFAWQLPQFFDIWQTNPDFRVKAYMVCQYPYGGFLYDYNLQAWVENTGGNKGLTQTTKIPVQFYIPHYYPDPLWDETDGYRIKYVKPPFTGDTIVVTWSGETFTGPLPVGSNVWADRNDHYSSLYKSGKFYPYAGTIAESDEFNNKKSLFLYPESKSDKYCWFAN